MAERSGFEPEVEGYPLLSLNIRVSCHAFQSRGYGDFQGVYAYVVILQHEADVWADFPDESHRTGLGGYR